VTASRSPLHATLERIIDTFSDVSALAFVDHEGGLHGAGACISPDLARRSVDGLFAAADAAAANLNESGLDQVVVDTPDGAVAALRAGRCQAIAVTRPRPSSLGLLLYELRRVLDGLVDASPDAQGGRA
jgi:predicted regulator of Ras-like GTPase activity (Roadblock/LC7/MglB family)